MRLKLKRRWREPETQSIFGQWQALSFRAWSCEREWQDNKRNVSCVPAGFYVLVPHSGPKYQDTYALIGETVSNVEEPSIARYTCVVHSAEVGAHLAGCLSAGWTLEPNVTGARLGGSDEATQELLELLHRVSAPHYLTIEDCYE